MSKQAAATAVAPINRNNGLVAKIAGRFNVDADRMLATLKATAFRVKEGDKEVTNEQMMALLVVADQYNLNPFTKEIYAFPDKGGIVPIVSVDGWIRIINEKPEIQSIEFEYAPDDTDDAWIACTITRKDRSMPLVIREYMSECKRNTPPWGTHPRRMLRHKALIQCARIAFGFAGIYDPDEAERIRDANAIDGEVVAGRKPATEAPQPTNAAAAQITHVPVQELRTSIDQIGIPESQFCAHFEIGSVEELELKQVPQAWAYLEEMSANASA